MKKLFVLLIVSALLIAAAVPVFAAGKARSKPFALSGKIVAVDMAAQIVKVEVVCGNKIVQPYFGGILTIQTSSETDLLSYNPEGIAALLSFNSLNAGENINLNGQSTHDEWVARRVTVGGELICLP